MKIIQIVPKAGLNTKLKTMLNEKVKELRSKGGTFYRDGAGKLKHIKNWGWINWSESKGGILIAEVKSRVESADERLMQAFIGFLSRHFASEIESITVHFR